MRYRLEKAISSKEVEGEDEAPETVLLVHIWPEPFNYHTTPKEEMEQKEFSFDEDGVVDAVAWMNDRLFEEKDRFDRAPSLWDRYHM